MIRFIWGGGENRDFFCAKDSRAFCTSQNTGVFGRNRICSRRYGRSSSHQLSQILNQDPPCRGWRKWPEIFGSCSPTSTPYAVLSPSNKNHLSYPQPPHDRWQQTCSSPMYMCVIRSPLIIIIPRKRDRAIYSRLVAPAAGSFLGAEGHFMVDLLMWVGTVGRRDEGEVISVALMGDSRASPGCKLTWIFRCMR